MKIASRILSTLILILLIIALVLFTIPRIFGIQMYNVISGSMKPTYNVGDIVYAFPVKDGKDIKEGDVITYLLDAGGTVATHRVVRVEPDNDTQGLEEHERYLYYTKGDNNDDADGTPQYYRNVIGVVRFSVPMVGKLLQLIQTPVGTVVTITLLLAIILLTVIFNINNNKAEEGAKGGAFGSVRGGRVQQQEQQSGFGRNFGNKAIRENDRMPETMPGRDGEGEAPAAAGTRRVPPKGWGSGKSR